MSALMEKRFDFDIIKQFFVLCIAKPAYQFVVNVKWTRLKDANISLQSLNILLNVHR